MPVVKINVDKFSNKEFETIDNLCEAIHRDVSVKKIRQILKFYKKPTNKRKFDDIH